MNFPIQTNTCNIESDTESADNRIVPVADFSHGHKVPGVITKLQSGLEQLNRKVPQKPITRPWALNIG